MLKEELLLARIQDTYYASDFQLLQEVYYPHVPMAIAYDPDHKLFDNFDSDLAIVRDLTRINEVLEVAEKFVFYNLSSKKIENAWLQAFGGCISIYSITAQKQSTIHYIIGKYETIRFAFPNTLKFPKYLSQKHTNFDYPGFARSIQKLNFNWGRIGAVSDGVFFVYKKNEDAKMLLRDAFDPYYLFAEDYVFDRTATCVFMNEKNESCELKFGNSEIGVLRNLNEAKVLEAIQPYSEGSKLRFPTVLEKEHFLLITDNHPVEASGLDQINDTLIQEMGKLYQSIKGVTQVGLFFENQNILSLIRTFNQIIVEDLHPRGLSRRLIEDLCIELLILINRLSQSEPMYTSIYHGSFNPINVSTKKGDIYLNHWHNAQMEMPLFFDFFDFISYTVEKKENPLIGEFDDLMKSFLKRKVTMEIVRNHDVNFKLNLALYHIYHVVTTLEKFIKQRLIHPNANFVIKYWQESLQRMNYLQI